MGDISFTVELDPTVASGDEGQPAPAAAKRRDGTTAPGGATSRAAAGRGEEEVLSVSRLTRQIRALLEEALPSLAVEGEISNLKAAASGHLYFNLKDETAQIRCVMFRAAAQSLRFTLEEGMQVVLRGRLSVYEVRGEYQIQVLTLEPKGVGALQVAFEQLKRKLEAEGLFDPAHKRPLPFLPRRIGIVTSPRGAAIRDMLQVLGRRFPGLPVLICPATVQGDAAAGEIAAGIATLNRLARAQQIDVIIVGRGGGSVEDLWAFNEEVVARAIHASRVPVVSAVGHEVDYTIADFVADVRAPTPSAAAELVVPLRADLGATVLAQRRRLFARLQNELRYKLERWQALHARMGTPERLLAQTAARVAELRGRVRHAGVFLLHRARERHGHARQRLGAARPDRTNRVLRAMVRGLRQRLRPALRRHAGAQRERLAAAVELLESLSPLTVLRRGYGVVQDERGRVVRSVEQTRAGQALRVRLHDGRLTAEVRQIDRYGATAGGTADGGGRDEP
ncbi:MAG: exodeoxyribonuclease VII large subunit [Candidatus Lambdaproteobacteria bacterium]|nr:exodeoxyribonuclease VII large subunit [Candidatus Lambdaproteobacteria bacterium]